MGDMAILPRKAILAVAAVTDIALHAKGRPVSAKALAARHGLPPRHLEPVLQAFVREGILKGIRGPGGGYELAREAHHITAEEILRAAGTVDDVEPMAPPRSQLVTQVVSPAMAEAERAFASMLSQVSVADMVRRAASTPA
jgi:Rrf2 family transcriptional regulator, iron-sulfur cluster assembly transcription factor